MKARALLLAMILATAASAKDRIGIIDFFGYKGIDVAKLRAAIPYKEGVLVKLSERSVRIIRDKVDRAVEKVTGGPATDINFVCCDRQGDWEMYIGVRGVSFKELRLNPQPKGPERLPDSALELYQRYIREWMRTVSAGTPTEDESKGYALSNDAALRTVELEMRAYVLANEDLVRSVLESSALEEHRKAAAALLGYANQSKSQIAALVAATRDQSDVVRNNVTRAIGAMAAAGGDAAREIPTGPFVEMLSSGVWTDRNKGLMVLGSLIKGRGPEMEQLRDAVESLVEMAAWQCPDHSATAATLLGRLEHIPEANLQEMVKSGQKQPILDAAPTIRRN